MMKYHVGTATVALGLVLAWASHVNAAPVYIALGDSITFGETDLSYVQSNGDRGYVADFANTLATRNNGIAPTVINLAIDGETASSFMTNSGRTPPAIGRGDVPLQLENLNYNNSTSFSQSQLFANAVALQQAAGNSISTISFTLGFNEVAALAPTTNTPAAEAAALAQVPATLAAFRANDQAVLNEIHTLAPTATVYMESYFNPFPADPTNPAAPLFAVAGPELNSTIQSLAAQNDAIYVDNATPFVGNEAAYTYEGVQPHGAITPGTAFVGVEPIGDVHPNTLGYSVIAADTAAATAVPEPTTWALLIPSLGLIGLMARGRRPNGAVTD